MPKLSRYETSNVSRLRSQLPRDPASQASRNTEIDRLKNERESGQLSSIDFFISIKDIEYSLIRSTLVSPASLGLFLKNELNMCVASKEEMARLTKLLNSDDQPGAQLTQTAIAEACEVCRIAWQRALFQVEREAKTGQWTWPIMLGCLAAFVTLKQLQLVISAAKSPFIEAAAGARPPWDLLSDSAGRILQVVTTDFILASVLLGIAGSALALFRKGPPTFEVGIMFREPIWNILITYLAVGAWSGFLAQFFISSVIQGIANGETKNLLAVAGCFSAGLGSSFLDVVLDRVWVRLGLGRFPNIGIGPKPTTPSKASEFAKS